MPKDEIDEVLEQISKGNYGPAEKTIRAFLNEAGQLESLVVAFPQQYAQAAFVLQALEKWQFRPARQQGRPTAVEVLLIIPDELD